MRSKCRVRLRHSWQFGWLTVDHPLFTREATFHTGCGGILMECGTSAQPRLDIRDDSKAEFARLMVAR
jgi:hypothetical protein